MSEVQARILRFATLLLLVVATTTLALLVRLYIVEPEQLAAQCAAAQEGWRCAVRQFVVAGFLKNAFGIGALAAGAAALILRLRILALCAIVLGVVGAVFYRFELSGAGLLLGALVWVHQFRTRAELAPQGQAN